MREVSSLRLLLEGCIDWIAVRQCKLYFRMYAQAHNVILRRKHRLISKVATI